MQISRVFVILFSYLTLVVGQRCEFPVPFSSKLVGRRFFSFDTCYRPVVSSNIKIFPKSFVYTPVFAIRFFTASCEEKYVFHLRRGEDDPFVVYFPELEHPKGFKVSSTELEEFCKNEHSGVREKYLPTGETRKMFKRAVRTIVKGALRIRDYGCTETDEGFSTQVEGRAFTNVDLDGIVTYLLSVGYQYNFCAEPAEQA